LRKIQVKKLVKGFGRLVVGVGIKAEMSQAKLEQACSFRIFINDYRLLTIRLYDSRFREGFGMKKNDV
jgi:hypothetical protein